MIYNAEFQVYSKVIQLYIIYICMYVYSFRFFSIIDYFKILSIVLYAI